MAWRRTDPCCVTLHPPPPRLQEVMPACSSACPARGRIRADQSATGHPSSRSVAATPLRRPNWQPARSKNAVQLGNLATCGPLVKALIRESPRDTDHKKITTDRNTTPRSKIDRKNHDGHRAISDQLPARRGRRDHGASVRRRLLSELSRPVWKSTSASVNLHAIEQRLPSSRRR